jgi:CBS domain-containing protein
MPDFDDFEAEGDDIEAADVEARAEDAMHQALDDMIRVLGPAEPICLRETATVSEAIDRMLTRRQAGVLIVDADGRLVGIFTERDVLMRVVGRGRDARQTRLGEVMTSDPEALNVGHRVAYAVHCMSVAGYRTVPLVDAERRPIGIVTATDIIRWLAGLFPEAVLNLPPGDTLKHPHRMDAG